MPANVQIFVLKNQHRDFLVTRYWRKVTPFYLNTFRNTPSVHKRLTYTSIDRPCIFCKLVVHARGVEVKFSVTLRISNEVIRLVHFGVIVAGISSSHVYVQVSGRCYDYQQGEISSNMSATISKIPATSAGNGIDVICDKDRVSTVLFYNVNVECRSFGVTIMKYSSNFNV